MGILRTLLFGRENGIRSTLKACSAATVAARRIGLRLRLFRPELRHAGCPTGR